MPRWVGGLAWLSLVLIGLPALGEPVAREVRLAIVTPVSESLSLEHRRELEGWLRADLRRAWKLNLPPPQASLPRPVRDPELLAKRRRAQSLLKQASPLVERMRYDEARRLLAEARSLAENGLARLVDPPLLGEVYLQWGIATLPTQPDRARRRLVRSYRLWPEQQTHTLPDLSPKIADELRQARTRAFGEPIVGLDTEHAVAVARLLEVKRVLFLFVGPLGEQVGVRPMLFDVTRQRWSAATAVPWPAAADRRGEAREKLLRALHWLLPGRRVVSAKPAKPAKPAQPAQRALAHRPRARTSIGPWITAGLGTLSLAAGGLLLGLAHAEAAEAESLAGGQVEYYPEVHDKEKAARRLQTAGVITLGLGAAAAAAAAIWWLSARPATEPRPETPRLNAWPGGVSFVLPLR